MHQDCLRSLADHNTYVCPCCSKSYMSQDSQSRLWAEMDEAVASTPMPLEYADMQVNILCNDCHALSTVKFHVTGLKCTPCGAYNTGGCDGYRKHGVEEGAGSLAVRKELTQGGAVGGVHADSMFSLATGVAIQDYDAAALTALTYLSRTCTDESELVARTCLTATGALVASCSPVYKEWKPQAQPLSDSICSCMVPDSGMDGSCCVVAGCMPFASTDCRETVMW
eukprot:CAMPEP_0119112320 /NCGR_PEP_ID=MMETSP1180-20130426/39747_1 /TAXON_ID=3052 ORGANISM="Chlamydomonas cf sp, Strain CCMP681" /NCGR_SAMPLE_ID=MMETSP1180 /ASSEMBLY_ACC=CAM_ASM_000741 /LENGTH=224 /DNA_ID=CAMNT_0007099771 /DNA_START=270 /DNA_END=943 /DNA_ORIENTATION=-